MPRLLVVACLLLAVPLSGCFRHAQAVKPADGPWTSDETPPWVEPPSWLEAHPLVQGTLVTAGLVALVALVVVAYLKSGDGSDSDTDAPVPAVPQARAAKK